MSSSHVVPFSIGHIYLTAIFLYVMPVMSVSIGSDAGSSDPATAPGAAQLPYGGQPLFPAGLGANGKSGGYSAGKLPYGVQPIQPAGLGADTGMGKYGERNRLKVRRVGKQPYGATHNWQ